MLNRSPHRPGDPPVGGNLLARCRQLLADAERTPRDEPAFDRTGPAAELERLTASLVREADESPEVGDLWLIRANALRCLGRARDDEAQQAFFEAGRRCKEPWRVWFDLGLLHKWRARWKDALQANERALGECPRPHRGIHWNIAIAATALGRGDRAQRAWSEVGLPCRLASGGQAIAEQPLPSIHVRLPVRGEGGPVPVTAWSFEVVRVAPLSPCHGVIESATFRDAPCDYGDVILWDGSPVGSVPGPVGKPTEPVFPLLEILSRGNERRFRLVAPERVSVGEIEHVLAPFGPVFWRRRDLDDAKRDVRYGVLVVSENTDLARVRQAVESIEPKCVAMPGLYEAIGDTARAGKEHQAWLRLETRARQRGE